MRNDPADAMFFIIQGEMEVVLRLRNKTEKRLTTLTAGMSFGELAMLNRNKRSAEVRARADTLCYEISFDDIPDTIRMKMLVNLAGILAAKLDQEAEEITALSC
jgi:CRP-like cAMP-binding protein